PPHTLGHPNPTSSSSTSKTLGDPGGAFFSAGKSGVESTAYVRIFAFGNDHSGSGRWCRWMWTGKESAPRSSWFLSLDFLAKLACGCRVDPGISGEKCVHSACLVRTIDRCHGAGCARGQLSSDNLETGDACRSRSTSRAGRSPAWWVEALTF